jgi:hypothetical protein
MSGFIEMRTFNRAMPAPVARPQIGLMTRISNGFGPGWNAFTEALDIIISRGQLTEIDDRMLQDLGISRAQANFEASRRPWNVGRRARGR